MALTTQLFTAVLISLCSIANALPWMEDQVPWNLNQNQHAADPTQYWGEWTGHDYNPSPKNWRMPFYALTADRFADGDPTNSKIDIPASIRLHADNIKTARTAVCSNTNGNRTSSASEET
jgi:hypothetical protein